MREWPNMMKLMGQYPNHHFFLDSGSFTYGSSLKKQSKQRLPNPEEYFRLYKSFLTKYHHLFDFVREVDLFDHWQKDYLEQKRNELLEIAPNLVICWDINREKEEWMAHLENPMIKHLAITPSKTIKDLGPLARLVNLANGKGKTVHGFSQTKLQTVLKWIKYYSVDSRSWQAGELYGDLYVFRNNQWKLVPGTNKDLRKQYQSYWKSIGCDPALIYKDDPKELNKANVIAWSRMAKRIELIHRPRSSQEAIERNEPTSIKKSFKVTKDGKLIIKKQVSEGDSIPKDRAQLMPLSDKNLPDTQSSTPKRTFLNTIPKFTCSTCIMAGECPEYKEGYVCAFTDQFASFGTRNTEEIKEIMGAIVQQNTIRLQRAYMIEEQITGGQLDTNVTHLSNIVMDQAKELRELERQSESISLTAHGSKGLGILAQLFGRPKDIRDQNEEVIDVTSQPVLKSDLEEAQIVEDPPNQPGVKDEDNKNNQ